MAPGAGGGGSRKTCSGNTSGSAMDATLVSGSTVAGFDGN